MVTDPLPLPEGFVANKGFEFTYGSTYAKAIPHKGLISVLWLDERTLKNHIIDSVFPEEEFIHCLSISRNPVFLFHALMEYWDWPEAVAETRPENHSKRNVGRNIVLQAWRPFYEALATVYSDLIDMEARRKNAAYSIQIGHYEYQKQQIRQTNRKQPRQSDDSTGTVTDYLDIESQLRKDAQSQIEERLTSIITEYIDRGLLEADLKAWDSEGAWFTHAAGVRTDAVSVKELQVYQMIETFLPSELYLDNQFPYDQDPVNYWAAIQEILAAWQHEIAQGESPFPIERTSFQGNFLANWGYAVCGVLRMLDFVIQRHPQKVVASLPAIFHVLNPFLVDHAVMVTPTNQASILFPCVLLSAGSSDRCYFVWAIRRGKSVAPRAFENCLLYDRLKDWYYIGPADEMAAEPDAFISNAARQIEEFGISLEDLWLYQQSDVPCPHCQDLLALIENDDFLQLLLENRKFTQLQKDDHFADLASLYPEWLEQEVAATLHGPRL